MNQNYTYNFDTTEKYINSEVPNIDTASARMTEPRRNPEAHCLRGEGWILPPEP